MNLNSLTQLVQFLSNQFSETDSESDPATIQSFAASTNPDVLQKITLQLRQVIEGGEVSIEDLGTICNRWFGDSSEAKAWLGDILRGLDQASQSNDQIVVKDSNGAVLAEGDSVTVIKDLKVKGGTSDLKRGTMIKKIHLIGDPGNIECRVDGSTLVLKTEFLRKA